MSRPPLRGAAPRGGFPHRPRPQQQNPYINANNPYQNPNNPYQIPFLPQFICPNPSFFPPNPNFAPNFAALPNPSFSAPANPNFAAAPNPSFPAALANPNLNPSGPGPPSPSPAPRQHIQRIEAAVGKAHTDIVRAGRSVTAWQVSEAALNALNAETWTALGVQIKDIPSLHRLLLIEGKVGAFIHCFVGARRITTLYELEVAMCKNEGIGRFEELRLGPLARHPLVEHYFSVDSGAMEIFKITSEDIIAFLRVYISKRKKVVVAEQFLDFVAKQKSVTKKKLGVRIQSLELHIACINEAKKAEESVISGSFKTRKHSEGPDGKNWCSEGVGPPQPPLTELEKRVLDKRFDVISKRINSFTTEWDGLGGKHTRFEPESDVDVVEDDDDDEDADTTCQYQDSCLDNDAGQRVSSCPYPSTSEEMERLGLKSEISEQVSPGNSERSKRANSFSGKKRKPEDTNGSFCNRKKQKSAEKNDSILRKMLSKNDSNSHKMSRKEHVIELEVVQAKVADLTLASCDMDKFITTWKEACREHSVSEVLDMMLNFYIKTDKKQKKMRKVFSLYPGIGLLHVAVASIKGGMMDSLYDAFQTIGEHGVGGSSPAPPAEMIEIGPSVEVSNTKKGMDKLEQSISVDVITKKVTDYFKPTTLIPSNNDIFSGKSFAYLKELSNCESWLSNQFSVKEFRSLGYGSFFDFLEKHALLIPHELHIILSGNILQPPCLEVTMLDQLLRVLLSQVKSTLIEGGSSSKNVLSMILKKQFPTLAFIVLANEPDKPCDDPVNTAKECDIDSSSCLLFSTALLGSQWIGNSLPSSGKPTCESSDSTNEASSHYSFLAISSKDAIDCLLRAPMLSDLISWSHWDVLYAPSLGPLLEWLLNEVRVKDILCIATVEGKLIRIENSATVDEFLEALVLCSPFQAALKLLSLLSLYGGTKSIPLSLLKCYMHRAIDVMIKNSVDSNAANTSGENTMHGSSIEGQFVLESLCRIKEGVLVVSKFILECLGHLPREFWNFAADLFVSGLRSFSKDAPSVMLNSCSQADQRLMLHDIGLSLGIPEWIEDYHNFCTTCTTDMFVTSETLNKKDPSLFAKSGYEHRDTPNAFDISVSNNQNIQGTVTNVASLKGKNYETFVGVGKRKSEDSMENKLTKSSDEASQKEEYHDASDNRSGTAESSPVQDAASIVESIRREEFGLEPNLNYTDSCLLRKQHARLGRALHCLSQELYSQDSHLLLELVQNADDNIYPENVDPTLVFILQDTGIVVLNNERGFSEQNIKALCDIGSSTKKGSSAGYIGHKGIGFKSVFRVTDAPEIHSNGFHVKFDITDGQIGFVLPTVTSACDMKMFQHILYSDNYMSHTLHWGTCIVLPFRSKFRDGTGMNSIISMFSDLHPSLLLFLHRLQCIAFKNMLTDKLVIMKKEVLGTGIVEVSHGEEKMSWLVVKKNLEASTIRQDVQTTEIAMAFTLQETDNGQYKPHLRQQPVFAFLPLRNYGLKFIIQGDFVLPSSREEVDGNSAWNQWLLSELPALFVNAVHSFCALPCFQDDQGKAVTAYMSFIPLIGEVNGFFSRLPHLIISKLRMSKCLLLDGSESKWVIPCRVLRGWNDQVRMLLPDNLLQEHLGLGYLSKDVVLSDTLAKALGIQEYGTKILVDVISAICRIDGGISSLGLNWLSSWLDALYLTLSFPPSGYSLHVGVECDIISSLREVPFIPLTDGLYSSLSNGPIWLPCDSFSIGSNCKQGPDHFPRLYAKLRTVNPLLFSAVTTTSDNLQGTRRDNAIQVLRKIGVQQLSAHDVIRSHILVALSSGTYTNEEKDLMIEYLSFIMLHFQYDCPSCHSDKAPIISELCKYPVLLTSDGYKCPSHEAIHFGMEYGNLVDIDKLTAKVEFKWLELDASYLNLSFMQSVSSGLTQWREFFQQLGVTDFVQVNRVDKNISGTYAVSGSVRDTGDLMQLSSISDWESPELANLLSTLSSKKCRAECIYLLEILDSMWDDYYNAKSQGCAISEANESKTIFESSFMKSILEFKWIASSMDRKLHHSKELFYDCEEVRSLLGTWAPYAVPKVTSKLLLNNIRFKTQVSLEDALSTLHSWRLSKASFTTSLGQMTKLYTFISDEITHSNVKIIEELIRSSFIFVPFPSSAKYNDAVSGMFLSPKELYWHDPTGCADKTQEMIRLCTSVQITSCSPCRALANIYPSLHDFFVNKCGVHCVPTFGSYFQILIQLSTVALPSQSAHVVFQVLLKWADDIKSGSIQSEEVSNLKEKLVKLENTILPTLQDKWVSLHPSFGIICWADDEELKQQFKNSAGIDFLQFGELNDEEKKMLSGKVSVLLHDIGVPSLSEIVSREAITYGAENNREKASLINWILPFAQRYMLKLHADVYRKMIQGGLENLHQLKVVVVEKLFYKYTLKGRDSSRKKRCECSCLLQGNILYATRMSDSHSLFLELSRLFFDGSAELHLANFLHMVTNMAESGSTAEQTEFFITNTQKVPELPKEETVWSLSSFQEYHNGETSLPSPIVDEPKASTAPKRKPGISPNWPPRDWRSAPDFNQHRKSHLRKSAGSALSEVDAAYEDIPVTMEVDGDWLVKEGLNSGNILQLLETETMNDQPQEVFSFDPSALQINPSLEHKNVVDGSVIVPEYGVPNFPERDRSFCQAAFDKQTSKTGRLGESIAHKHFVENLGFSHVKWVNEETETGLPYDLIVGNAEGGVEYIEVKSTRSSSKGWFEMSAREWQFASECGDSFSIAHVTLLGPNRATVLVLKNPVKLCQKKVLQLALLMSRQLWDAYVPTTA